MIVSCIVGSVREGSTSLQDDLDCLQQWEKDLQMSFNPTKYVVLRIHKETHPINATYKIHGHDSEVVKQGKYLADNLTLKNHMDEIAKKY